MNDELRVAAKRYGLPYPRASVSGDMDWDSYIQEMKDMELLADAYLAEHREDDAEPVTEEWLRSIGAKDEVDGKIDGEPLFNLYIGPACLCYFPSGVELLIDHHHGWPLKTRGQVRLMCRSLSIEMKETP